MTSERVRVAAVNDFDIVVQGLAGLLSQHDDRLEVVDAIVIGEPLDGDVDVALFDTFGRRGVGVSALKELMAMPEVDKVALFTLELTPDAVAEARQAGAAGFISKGLSGTEIADALVRIAQGEAVIAGTPGPPVPPDELLWPGKEAGLTEQQSQILALLADGLSNREIAAAMYLSPETVKTYLRPIYRALGVRNRVEAATWARDAGSFTRRGI
jgi:DNA-binding NarL/FixJ family response regulator